MTLEHVVKAPKSMGNESWELQLLESEVRASWWDCSPTNLHQRHTFTPNKHGLQLTACSLCEQSSLAPFSKRLPSLHLSFLGILGHSWRGDLDQLPRNPPDGQEKSGS